MKLSKCEKEALRLVSLGIIKHPNRCGIRYDTICDLVKMKLIEWHNWAGMQRGYRLTDAGCAALEEMRK